MSQPAPNLDDLIDALDALQSKIAAAVADSDWVVAAELCEDRQQVLALAFDAQPATPTHFRRLRDIAERVMETDAALLAAARDARRETADALKSLTAGRRATKAYLDDAG